MFALGDLVKLRAMESSEADTLWRWKHDPEVMRWMDHSYVQPLHLVRAWLQERRHNDYGDVFFGIEALSDGKLIGMIRLHSAEPEIGNARLDIYLGEKDYWGKGYATDAVRTACRYGFDKMRLHKITLTVVTENHAAHRVYGKVGFVEEGRLREVFRRDGRWYDKYTMGLLAGELREATPPPR